MFSLGDDQRLRQIAAAIPRIEERQKLILEYLNLVLHKETTMSAEIDRLTASVTNLTTVDASLVTLVGNLAQLLRDSASDPAAINALADKLDAEAATVAQAVTDNTPAAT